MQKKDENSLPVATAERAMDAVYAGFRPITLGCYGIQLDFDWSTRNP